MSTLAVASLQATAASRLPTAALRHAPRHRAIVAAHPQQRAGRRVGEAVGLRASLGSWEARRGRPVAARAAEDDAEPAPEPASDENAADLDSQRGKTVNWSMYRTLLRNQVFLGSSALYANQQTHLLQWPEINPEVVLLGVFGSLPLIVLGILADDANINLGAANTRDTQALVTRMYGWNSSVAYIGFLSSFLCLVTALCEETSFRGLVLPTIVERLEGNLPLGVALSSVLFGVAHFSGEFSFEVAANLLILSICGLWFAVLTVFSGGNLVSPILAHFLYDLQVMFGAFYEANDKLKYVQAEMAKPGWGLLKEEEEVRELVYQITKANALDDKFVKVCRATFFLMDSDRNGVIDRDELRMALASMGYKKDAADIEQRFLQVGQGKEVEALNFGEFLQFVVDSEITPTLWYRGLLGF